MVGIHLKRGSKQTTLSPECMKIESVAWKTVCRDYRYSNFSEGKKRIVLGIVSLYVCKYGIGRHSSLRYRFGGLLQLFWLGIVDIKCIPAGMTTISDDCYYWRRLRCIVSHISQDTVSMGNSPHRFVYLETHSCLYNLNIKIDSNIQKTIGIIAN